MTTWRKYARIIQESQHDLGLEVSSFDNIGMSAASFLWELARKDKQQEVQGEEEYPTDSQYEQDRLTDTNSEYFRDDFNAGDRFTS